MATTLVGQTIGSTFRQITHVDGGLASSESALLDGDGTEAAIKVGTDNINVSTHNGSDKGLKLQNTLVTASAAEINQLDNKTVGGSGGSDIPTNDGTSSFDNKTIDGGSY
tara:strand:- start:2628 stop:2957 length:330 start_codon:yes stop_codon:yes gene_type:complete